MGKKLLVVIALLAAIFGTQQTAESQMPTLLSEYAIVMNSETNDVVWHKNSEARMYPASLTKLMTVLVADEQLGGIEQRDVTLRAELFDRLEGEGAAMAGFARGETVSLEALFYGALLPSGAEATVALAEEVSGTEQQFVDLMNEKARELQMNDTHFVNSTGLHHDDHYSTVSDVAKLVQAVMRHDELREIIATKSYVIPATNKHPNGMTLQSTVPAHIAAGKTGYTFEAGHCLASFATVNGTPYIVVTGGAEQDGHFRDAETVYTHL